MKIQEQAPAKINLALDILGRRTDGYHELRMVMQSVSLCDTVTVEETGTGFTLLADGFTVPAGKSSLEQQAAEAFFAAVGRPVPPLTVHLEKTTPAYAGLGGGSADVAALLRCRGAAVFEENLFSSRYRHVDELARMGADIRVSGRTAVVLGVERLHGAAVRCTDLRGGAALCAAALAAEGETSISDITHIDRGYQSIEDDLAALGADIRRVEETASP